MDIKIIIALVLEGLSILLDIVGLSIPYWSYISIDQFSGSLGLWSFCADRGTGSECESYPSGTITDGLPATRALVILGLLAAVGAIACFLVRLFMMKDKAILNKIAAGVAVLAGLFMLIGAIIYVTSFHSDQNKIIEALGSDERYSLHAGFALVIIAALFSIGAAVVMFLSPVD